MINIAKIYEETPLGNMSALELSITMEAYLCEISNTKLLIHARDFATLLHAKQTRKTRNEFKRTPYIEHPMRNTLRLLRWGIRDTDILIASLLHDVVEDTSKRFTKVILHKPVPEAMAKIQLMNYIEMTFGKKVAHIVQGVTNPELPTDSKEKALAYQAHVTQAIKGDTGIFLVKLSDFVDNAVGLWHSPDDQFIARQAGKYQPMIRVFRNELNNLINNDQLSLPVESILDIKFKLDYANTHLNSILEQSKEL